ncbi:sigma-70 family RNA polymerase sigma factor [Stieleria sp. JC731]|uniref:sigma-70 family RNA polymerase sigma factor n=1 Tax=Pirellulaceae TaxID=2691357 RepID=UPI001E445391|nr:sigma-70 family RNA polymerase sigma factor [Stieleria sp. JC731]MCC9601889.1 sigma-70 family RNA polymerase sigma factor [Stieleria sp. JC731]
MNQDANHEDFIRCLTESQTRLYGYVYSLLGDHSLAADVVQETNLVLWRKMDEFVPGQSFLRWAFGIARFQVLSHYRDQKRDRLLLDSELVEVIGRESELQAEGFDSFRLALRPCLKLLAPNHRSMIEQRYFHSMPIAEVAERCGRSVGAIKTALVRIRQQLGNCVQKRLATEA